VSYYDYSKVDIEKLKRKRARYCSGSVTNVSEHQPVGAGEMRPPTLREWLGDQASDLPPGWLEVLREQPVPAGWIARWEWSHRSLRAVDAEGAVHCVSVYTLLSSLLPDWNVGVAEAYVMGCFLRHLAVKPAPKPVRTWFGNEEEL